MTTAPVKGHHGMHWNPVSQVGRWALGLAGIAVAGTVALALAIGAGLKDADGAAADWFLAVWGVAILVSATASAVTGLVALFRAHDHAWWVVGATVLGVLAAALMLQQVFEGLGWLGS